MSATLQRVWLILTKVRVVAENPIGLTLGSEPLVQCFIPETAIEVALSQTDRLLQSEGMRRVDVMSCSSFDRPEDQEESPDFVKRDVHQARSSGKPLTGTFFTSPDTATFEKDETHDG
ncbi:MAG: hypothetical protein V9H26_10250 [Verrucomicrobiota bacterium]|nr:hypothetical protein [Limisphaerales bacterium]